MLKHEAEVEPTTSLIANASQFGTIMTFEELLAFYCLIYIQYPPISVYQVNSIN